MSKESILPFLSILGPLYLGIMAVSYVIPPIRHHLIHRSPPGIISLTYTGLTAWSITLGIGLTISEPFLQIVNEATRLMFLEGKAEAQGSIMVIAIFASSCFMLGNLLRSYFNLHRIEDSPVPRDQFTVFISGLRGRSRWIELSFRMVIFLTILFIEYQVVSLRSTLKVSESIAQRADDFRTTFNLIWTFALILYTALLAWDAYLLLCLRNGGQEENKATVLQALPVHVCGFLVAASISLSAYISDLSILLTYFAFFVSLGGVFLLLLSLKRDRSLLGGVFRAQA